MSIVAATLLIMSIALYGHYFLDSQQGKGPCKVYLMFPVSLCKETWIALATIFSLACPLLNFLAGGQGAPELSERPCQLMSARL